MFKEIIQSTPFTSTGANMAFSNIHGEPWRSDFTFLSTLRALLGSRLKNNEELNVLFRDSTYSASQLSGLETTRALEIATGRVFFYNGEQHDAQGVLLVSNFYNPTAENNNAWMTMVKQNFCKVHPEWRPLEKVTLFFQKRFDVACFVEPVNKNVIICTNNMDIRDMHYLQCGIFAFLPWYFNPEEGVSEIEMELINSLRENKSEKYKDCLTRMSEQYDFRTIKIKELLSGFESRYESRECERLRSDIESIIYRINELNNKIGIELEQKRDTETKLLGIETAMSKTKDESEIMEYFLCNNHLVLESVDNVHVLFGVKDYITYFDEDMAKSMIDNEHSYIYEPRGRTCNNIIPTEDMKKLMTAIFLDQTLRVRVCAAYDFQLDSNVRARDHFSYKYEYDGYTPNPHIDKYRCLGNYERQINSLLLNNNYIGAIEQCIASCKSLNFADSTVMQEFMLRVYGLSDERVNMKCIELPDGAVVTPKEAVVYLKQQEENANG